MLFTKEEVSELYIRRVFNKVILFIIFTVYTVPTQAALALDRNRVIFHEEEKSISLSIKNDNKFKPYLAKVWLQDQNDRTENLPLFISPALQRVNPGQKTLVRLKALPVISSYPQDRESLFYLNVLEIPTVSEKPNVMQIALNTKIKVFYRPKGLQEDRRFFNMDKFHIISTGSKYKVVNDSGFYFNISSYTDAAGKMTRKSLALKPFSTEILNFTMNRPAKVTIVNDFGTAQTFNLKCAGQNCSAILDE